jgi:ADP-heptose:LPS heptosyltransferase
LTAIFDPMENILLIRLKSIGDILFTLPAVHAVRENFPDAKLHFLVSKEYAPLLRGFSEIDEIIPLDRAVYRSRNLPAMCSSAFQLLRRLREGKFSVAIDFHGYGETELLSWWSGAPERWGSVYHPARGWTYTRILPRGRNYDPARGWTGARVLPRDRKIHPVEWNLLLLQECGLRIGEIRNEYVLPADALEKARRFFEANKLDENKPTLFIQPFTSAVEKNWPLENFLKLGWHWQSRGVQVLFGGGVSERDALKPARAAGFPVSAGAPLLVSAGLMQLSQLVVGGDTGLLHLAVAMGRRVVMIARSRTQGETRPFGHADWVVLSPDSPQPEIGAVIEATTKAMNERVRLPT